MTNDALRIVESLLIRNTRNLLQLSLRVQSSEFVLGDCVVNKQQEKQEKQQQQQQTLFTISKNVRLLLDGYIDGDEKPPRSASALVSAIFPRSDMSDLIYYTYDCVIDYVEKYANGSPGDMLRTVKLIEFCAEFEKRLPKKTRLRGRRRRNWRLIFVPLAPEICRWVEMQTDAASPALADHLTNLAVACTDKLATIAEVVSAELRRFSTAFINRALRASRENGENKEELYALLDSISKFSQIPCPATRDEFSRLASALVERIVFLHEFTLLTGIFHDAESHDWQNDKPFFQDEKVSFAIRAWCEYVRALRNDLYARPPVYARRIFARVLAFSLSWFSQRYARVKASRARVPQFEADVSTILDEASEFAAICNDDDNHHHQSALHEHSNNLLATTATLRTFPQRNDIDDRAKSIGHQFGSHWPIVVELLVGRDCALPVAIVDQGGSENTARIILNALVSCHAFAHGLASTLVQLVKKHDDWEALLRPTLCQQQELPVWVRPLDELLERHCASIVAPTLFELTRSDGSKFDHDDHYYSSIADQLLYRALSTFSTLPLPMQLLFAHWQKELPASERNRLVSESAYTHMIATKCCRMLPSRQFADGLLRNLESRRSPEMMFHFEDSSNGYDYAVAAAQMMSSDERDALTAFRDYLLENKHWLDVHYG